MLFYLIERFVDDRIGFREVHRCDDIKEANRVACGFASILKTPHRVVTVSLEFHEPYGKTPVSSKKSVK